MDDKKLTVIEGGALALVMDYEKIALEYLESMGMNKLKKGDQIKFLKLCQVFQLNPFLREIYAIPFGNKFNIIVGYEVYLKRAESSGKLDGWRRWYEGTIEDGNLKGCIEISRKDWTKPFYHEVDFEEYDLANSIWKSKPKTMIKKVAASQGFRLCFPNELGGIPYTEDEIQTETPEKQPASPPRQALDHKPFLEKIASITNIPHLDRWIAKNKDTIRQSFTKGQIVELNAATTKRRVEIGMEVMKKDNPLQGEEGFYCPIHGDKRTHDTCAGLDCRQHCETFNQQ